MVTLKIKSTLAEEALGMMPQDKDVVRKYIADLAPDAPSREEEVEAVGAEEVTRNMMTVFPRVDGKPIWWDYQIKGMFKDACGMLRRVPGTKSSKLSAFKKVIDGVIFVQPRNIPINIPASLTFGTCERALRTDGPTGSRTCLASSETVPAGSWFEFTVKCLCDKDAELVKEWMDYTILRGFGQWRNSGKGLATWELVEEVKAKA